MGDIERVIERLEAVVDRARRDRNRIGFFAALYKAMTLAVHRDIEAGVFDDAERMSRFDALFAERYFDAQSTWEAGGQPTRSWRLAFEWARNGRGVVVQHLLLGINAHINLDLGVAAAQVAPGNSIDDLRADFDRINDTIESVVNPVQGVLGRFSPLLWLLDQAGGDTDEALLNFNLRAARRDAWSTALLLAAQRPERVEETISLLDRKVANFGRRVTHPGGVLPLAVRLVRLAECPDVRALIEALDEVDVGARRPGLLVTAASVSARTLAGVPARLAQRLSA